MESTDSSNQKKNPSTISMPSSSSRLGLPKAAGSKAAGSQQPDPDPWSSRTPEKPTISPRRLRNRGSALSLKDVRDAAQKLRQNRAGPSAGKPDPLMADAVPESSPAKSKKPDNSIKPPERYEILDRFYGSLDSSIRLLRIKGSTTTFSNISPTMECLTDRRFTHSHLAQIKYILPEALEIKKTLVYDERTSCMKPDLHITLDGQAVQDSQKAKSESKHVELRKVFRSRLIDFLKAHPEGCEIPEGDLPEPFNRSKKDVRTDLSTASALPIPPVSSIDQNPVVMSHFAPSFSRRFSRLGEIKQQDNIVASGASVPPVSTPQVIADGKQSCRNRRSRNEIFSKARSTESSPVLATPVKDAYCPSSEIALHVAPSKLTSTPMSKPPKRSYMSPGDVSTQPANKLERRPSRGRSLKFDTPVKNAEDDVQESSLCSAVDSELLDVLPDKLIRSIMEKEKKALLDQDPAISQAKWRQQMLSSLPKFFDTIYFLFQSIRRSVITKDELMHKIISSQVNIVDKREVEDQLKLLQELAPEWIYEKSSISGDILLCVNKISRPKSVRTRLAEAK